MPCTFSSYTFLGFLRLLDTRTVSCQLGVMQRVGPTKSRCLHRLLTLNDSSKESLRFFFATKYALPSSEGHICTTVLPSMMGCRYLGTSHIGTANPCPLSPTTVDAPPKPNPCYRGVGCGQGSTWYLVPRAQQTRAPLNGQPPHPKCSLEIASQTRLPQIAQIGAPLAVQCSGPA